MRTTTKYIDFTVTENKEGWLVECYDTEQEEPKDIQVEYWPIMLYVKEVRDCKKAAAMAWISDPENIGEFNDLIAEFVNKKY